MTAVQHWPGVVTPGRRHAGDPIVAAGARSASAPWRTRIGRRRFTALLVLLVLAGGALLAGRALAVEGASEPTVVTVKEGDTLSGLAVNLYPDRPAAEGVALLQHANNLGGYDLAAGERLLVPVP